MSDQAAEPTQTADAPEQAAPDPIMQRMEELTSKVDSLLPQEPEQPGLTDSLYDQTYTGQEAEQDPGQYDQQQGYDPGQYDGTQDLPPEQAAQQVNDLIDARVREQLAPIQQQQVQREQYQKALQLEQKYPDLQKGEVVGPVMKEVQARAMRSGNPDMVRDPEFIELVYLAQQAKTNASQQTAADGGSEAHLEGDGASPQQAEEDDFAQRVVNAGNGQSGADGSFRWY